METGKVVRLERITNRDSGNIVIIPMDHGISIGPVKGLINLSDIVNKVAAGGANAVLMQKGMVAHGHRGYGRDIGLIIHMSASTSLGPAPHDKAPVCTGEEALKKGAGGGGGVSGVGEDLRAAAEHNERGGSQPQGKHGRVLDQVVATWGSHPDPCS